MVSDIKPGGTFLLDCAWSPEELDEHLPASVKSYLALNDINFYIINATSIAMNQIGNAKVKNTVLQSAFFALANILPKDEAIEYMKSFKDILFDAKIVDTFLGFTAVYPAGTVVLTNEGETAIVLSQNKDFQDRPVIRILKDKDGKDIDGEVIKDLIKIHNIFIEKALD